MIPGKVYKPEDFLRAAWRRRFMIVVPIILSAVGAGFYSYTQPDEYRSETTLLVVPPSGAGGLVAGTEVSPLEDRLYTIRQQVVSHARLLQLVESEGLYKEWREAHPNGDVADRMRRDVSIDIVKGNPRRVDGTFFNISYVSTNPETAARVTNSLADLFVNENAADRAKAAEAATSFIEAQLADARGKLQKVESEIEAYNQRYAQELPSTMPSQMEALRRTEAQLQTLEASLSTDRSERVALEGLIAAAQMPLPPGAASSVSRRSGDMSGASIGAQLDAARSNLKALELQLTAEHPDVVRAKRAIQELEGRARAEGVPQSADGGVLSPAEVERRERLQQLESQLARLDRQIADKERTIPRLRESMAVYQARINNIPRHEAELTALTRDQATLQAVYSKLLASRENAGIASKLEAEQTERFRVIEPAKVPTSPFRPDRQQWALLGALFGLGLGIGLTVLFEFLDSSLRTDQDVAVALGLPVLAMIPVMHTAKELTTRRQLRTAASAMAVMAAVASVLALVW
jgi:polysaccharide chain length determinant protein (PEP-CTERM system associated)